MHRLLYGLWSPLPCRSTAACKKMKAPRCSMLASEGLRTSTGHPSISTWVIRRPFLENTSVSYCPDLYTLAFLFSFLYLPPCVFVICTILFKGVKEINSNSPFLLLIKMMARKNGRQYQFIYHKLSISYWATTDLSTCWVADLLIYFCFKAALMEMKEPLWLALLIKRWHKKKQVSVCMCVCTCMCVHHKKQATCHHLVNAALSLSSTPSHFSKSAWWCLIVCFPTECNLSMMNEKVRTSGNDSSFAEVKFIITLRLFSTNWTHLWTTWGARVGSREAWDIKERLLRGSVPT